MAISNSPPSQVDPDTLQVAEFLGLRNDVLAERFQPEDLSVGVNIDVDASGQISRRPGFTSRVAGDFHSLWSDGVTCLVVQGGQLMRVSTSYSLTSLRVLTAPTLRMRYTKVNDRIYATNGVDTVVVEAPGARNWGITPPAMPTVVQTVGSMPAGSYQFTMTYTAADGQESGARQAGVILLPAGSGLSLAMPVSGDSRVVSKTLYLTTPNGETLYKALTVDNSTVFGSYANNTTELAYTLQTQFLVPPPAGQLVCYYRGHMFVAQNEWLFPSEPFSYELFDLRKGIAMDGRITLLAPMEDKEFQGDSNGMNGGIFIGTDRSCGVLVGKEASVFQYVPKTDYGAIEGAVAFVDGTLYGDAAIGARPIPIWVSSQGVCVGLPQMEVKNLTRDRFTFTAERKGAMIFMPGPDKLIATTGL